jgi:hypothetical protein
MQLRKNQAQLRHRAQPAGDSAVRGEGSGLGLPLVVNRSDQELKHRREAIFVFQSDGHESFGLPNVLILRDQTGALLALMPGWQSQRRRVDHVQCELATASTVNS